MWPGARTGFVECGVGAGMPRAIICLPDHDGFWDLWFPTSLVVAHRLDQAQLADRVLFMEQGRIVEDGTHEELLQLGRRYAELFQQWKA